MTFNYVRMFNFLYVNQLSDWLLLVYFLLILLRAML